MTGNVQTRANRLTEGVLAGDRRALAQAISSLERGDTEARDLLALLFRHGGRAHIIGVTGAPGTGKSTLVNALARAYRRRGQTVGILAVDPTSPFSGGALLGDRLRMRDLAGDAGVYIRSMATRGATGGLSDMTAAAVQALDAAGYERVFIETVGAGQDEVEVAGLAHTVVVVEAPGLGDDIQAIKAGILEIANVLVVNKADRDGAQQTLAALRMMLELVHGGPATVSHHGVTMEALGSQPVAEPAGWRPPLLATVATQGTGIDAVMEAIEAHGSYLTSTPAGAALERQRAGAQLRQALDEALRSLLVARTSPEAYQEALEQVAGRSIDPHSAAASLVAQLVASCGTSTNEPAPSG